MVVSDKDLDLSFNSTIPLDNQTSIEITQLVVEDQSLEITQFSSGNSLEGDFTTIQL